MIKSLLFFGWILPGLVLIGGWAIIDLYRVLYGSEKHISWKDKRAFPTLLGIMVSFIPLFNIGMLIGSISTMCNKEKRKKYL